MSDPRDDWSLVGEVTGSPAVRPAFGDGVWVTAAQQWPLDVGQDYGALTAYVAETVDGPYTAYEIDGDVNVLPQTVAYGDGIWVMTGWVFDSRSENGGFSGSGPYSMAVYTASDPTGTWTRNSDLQDYADPSYVATAGTFPSRTIAFDGTTWATCGIYGDVWTATDPTDTWTMSFRPGYGIHDIVSGCGIWYAGDVWVFVVHPYWNDTVSPPVQYYYAYRIYTASNPAGTWTQRADVNDPVYNTYGGETRTKVGKTGSTYYLSTVSQLRTTTDITSASWDVGVDYVEQGIVDPDSSYQSGYVEGLLVADALYVLYGYLPSGFEDRSDGFVAASDALAGPYEVFALETDQDGSDTFDLGPFYDDGEWKGLGYTFTLPDYDNYRYVSWTPGGAGGGWGITLA